MDPVLKEIEDIQRRWRIRNAIEMFHEAERVWLAVGFGSMVLVVVLIAGMVCVVIGMVYVVFMS